MGLVRKTIERLDRDASRKLLALGYTALARIQRRKTRFFFDGAFWMYEWDGMALPDSRKFGFYSNHVRTLPARIKYYRDETEDCWFHIYKPKPGDVIVDVGAEIGSDTVTFSRAVGRAGKVVAIEAQPETFAKLQSTRRANRLANTMLVHKAVTDKPGEVRISADQDIQSNFLGDDGDLVPGDTLDTILKDVPHISLLKMNIEGAERLAIAGMDETLRKTDYLAIACHDFVARTTGNPWFETKAQVTAYLEGKGFTVISREEDPREYARDHLHAYRAQQT